MLGDDLPKAVQNPGFKGILPFNPFNSKEAQSKANILHTKGISLNKELLDYYIKHLKITFKVEDYSRKDAWSIAKSR